MGPIFMNRQGYIRNQLILQNRLMRKYREPVFRALESQTNEAAVMVEERGIEYTLTQIRNRFHINHEIGPIIQSLYKDAAIQARQRLKITKAAFGINLDFIQAVIDYFNKFLLEKVVIPISKTTQKLIEKVLDQAIKEGWGVEKTITELKSPDIPRWRARMIVRTESVAAMNYAQLKAADNKDFEVEKGWIAIEDKVTRFGNRPGGHNHLGVDGQRRDLYDTFSNGLLYPGDPNGAANQKINCRCSLGYYLKRDLEGNLIPKEKNILQAV